MDLNSLLGTNYYVLIPEGNELKLIHIGKGAYGYCFIFRWNPNYYQDFDTFKKFLEEHQVYNHYGRPVHTDFLMDYIRHKRGEKEIRPELEKIGKGDLVHIIEEKKEKKIIGVHEFVDDDFGVPVSEIEIKK
jgi:hypothetical protein